VPTGLQEQHNEPQKPVVAEDLAHEIGTPTLWRVENGGRREPLAESDALQAKP